MAVVEFFLRRIEDNEILFVSQYTNAIASG